MNSQGAAEFEPTIEWVNEDDCDTLLLYLPGFVKEQLRVQLRSRTLIISGQRKLHDNSWTRFRKEFLVSEHCDLNKISAKFEGSILYVKQPKTTTSTPTVKHEPKTSPLPEGKENPMQEPKVHEEKSDSKPTSITQPNGNDGADKRAEIDPEKNVGGNVEEPKGPKSDCSNASTKPGGSGLVTKLKPSRSGVVKVLVLVIGFVIGVYWANLTQSWIG